MKTFESFRHAVLEFTNAAGLARIVPKSDPVQVGSVNLSGDGAGSTECLPAELSCGVDTENIWAVSGGQTCYNCRGRGHYARECPSTGKGKGHAILGGSKGGGKSWEKGGKNQGKNGGESGGKRNSFWQGPFGGCWTRGRVTSPMSAR